MDSVASVTSPSLMGCFEALAHGQFLQLDNQKIWPMWGSLGGAERAGAATAEYATHVNQDKQASKYTPLKTMTSSLKNTIILDAPAISGITLEAILQLFQHWWFLLDPDLAGQDACSD